MYSVKRPSLYSKTILSISAFNLEVGMGDGVGSSSGIDWFIKLTSLVVEDDLSSVGIA